MNQVLRQLGGKIRHFDGAMGTMLQERGLLPGESPELWGLAHREEIVQIHRAYLEAGADFLKTNTFGANRFKLEGSGHTVEEVVTAGVENALQAVEASGHGTVFLDIGPTGKLLRPLGELDFEEAVSAFGEMVQAGCRAGAQGILLETMSDIYEAKAALLAAKRGHTVTLYEKEGALYYAIYMPTPGAFDKNTTTVYDSEGKMCLKYGGLMPPARREVVRQFFEGAVDKGVIWECRLREPATATKPQP